MANRTRTEFISAGDTVSLVAIFRDQTGTPADLDSFPQITIIQPSGTVMVGPTSAGMMQLSAGKYQYDFSVGLAPSLGVYTDSWVGFMASNRISASFNFVVHITDTAGLNTDGYLHLGDDFPFDYNQIEIFNINKLLKGLRARLNSRGKQKTINSFGDTVYMDCDIFSVDSMVTFLADSLTLFNEIPHFTSFEFSDVEFVKMFYNVLVQGALILALGSRAPIEKSNESVINDSGVSFTPASVSEVLMSQYGTELANHMEKLKFIKNSLKPYPISLGQYPVLGNGRIPAIRNLRLLRARQII